MNALVTGGGGFLGRYLVEQLLERGTQVRCFSRGRYPELESLGVETIQGDLRDLEATMAACQGIDVVFHVAGVAGIWGPRGYYHGINANGTANMLAAAEGQGVARFVYTSSPSVTFDGNDQCHIDETAPYTPTWLCHYPHSKAIAEQLVLQANGSHGLMTCALRPHLIWGPRDEHLIPRLLDRARQGKLRRIGDGTNLIDIVYVENAARAHLQAADAMEPGAAVCGRAYFISQGQPVNCWAWINELLEIAKLPPVTKSISLRAAWNAGLVLESVHRALRLPGEPRMTRFLAAQLARSHYFDITRAREDFGYSPQITTVEGMKHLAEDLCARS